MLVHQICSRVQALVDDPTYWSITRITALINQCKDSISDHFGLLANGYLLMESVIGQRSYALPLDFLVFETITWGNGNCLTPDNRISNPRDAIDYLAYTDVPGTPIKYFIFGKEDHQEIWFLPTFSSVVEIELFYWRRIPDVVNLNDEVMIPRDLHTKIVDYCLRQSWMYDELHNYSPEGFDDWWMGQLQQMQISKNVQMAVGSALEHGNFDDRMPAISNGSSGFNFRIGGTDGTQW
jgi:hypothetical protein